MRTKKQQESQITEHFVKKSLLCSILLCFGFDVVWALQSPQHRVGPMRPIGPERPGAESEN